VGAWRQARLGCPCESPSLICRSCDQPAVWIFTHFFLRVLWQFLNRIRPLILMTPFSLFPPYQASVLWTGGTTRDGLDLFSRGRDNPPLSSPRYPPPDSSLWRPALSPDFGRDFFCLVPSQGVLDGRALQEPPLRGSCLYFELRAFERSPRSPFPSSVAWLTGAKYL